MAATISFKTENTQNSKEDVKMSVDKPQNNENAEKTKPDAPNANKHSNNQRRNDTRRSYPRKPFVNNINDRPRSLDNKTTVKKTSVGKSRLFIGNLTPSMTEEEYKSIFEKFGTLIECFLNAGKGFGFIRYDSRASAENAKAALDGTMKDGRPLRVRYASQGSSLKVKHLSTFVTNELLDQAFSQFGEVERAVVIVNDRGRSIGEGIVEFSKKPAALLALKACNENCFLLTSSSQPITAEAYEAHDEDDGLQEKTFTRTTSEYMKERSIPPRMAEHGSFEFQCASRWKQLYAVEDQKREHLEKQILEERRLTEEELAHSYFDYETTLIREKLRRMEDRATHFQRKRDARLEEIRQFDEQLRVDDVIIRDREEEILRPRKPHEISSNSLPHSIPPPPPLPQGGSHDNMDAYDRGMPNHQHYPQYDSGYNKRPYPDQLFPEENKRRRY